MRNKILAGTMKKKKIKQNFFVYIHVNLEILLKSLLREDPLGRSNGTTGHGQFFQQEQLYNSFRFG